MDRENAAHPREVLGLGQFHDQPTKPRTTKDTKDHEGLQSQAFSFVHLRGLCG